jgi:hypothetical protein
MSEKTPRQIGEEAKAIVEEYGRIETRNNRAKFQFKTAMDNAQSLHNDARANESGKMNDPRSPEELRERRDKELGRLTEAVLKKAEIEVDEAELDASSRNHYKENAAAYHDLAVAEATLDGVKINVSLQESPEQQVKVHTS